VPGLLIDLSESGEPIGLEITAPGTVTLDDINAALKDWASIRSAPTNWRPFWLPEPIVRYNELPCLRAGRPPLSDPLGIESGGFAAACGGAGTEVASGPTESPHLAATAGRFKACTESSLDDPGE